MSYCDIEALGMDPTKLKLKKNGKDIKMKANALLQKAGNKVSAMNMATKIFGKEGNPEL
jgi:hypothetical protein